jgi:hypothetical protein
MKLLISSILEVYSVFFFKIENFKENSVSKFPISKIFENLNKV